ncbi:hypothetical protein [Roseibacillus ishigakijimensis]|uniref:Uncharacterized protein n=1 Tax=Roseibacillus ishigakijimensis TaxID=454146 RepID=A0A934RSU2_9BACT|nr:hypothetical protein [Roseibacillus ishigakijimensis]MBK1835016.1 hypothetical protein [Roseibacillus ishigakijimensis]
MATILRERPIVMTATENVHVPEGGLFEVHSKPSAGTVTVAKNGLAFEGFDAADDEVREGLYMGPGLITVTITDAAEVTLSRILP